MASRDLVDDRGVRKMFRQVNKWIRGEVPAVTKGKASRGARFARQIAPVDTGALYQAIDMAPGKSSKEWLVVSRQPNHPQSGRSKPYHMFLNMGLHGWGRRWHTAGEKNYRYMASTARYLRNGFTKEYIESLRKNVR